MDISFVVNYPTCSNFNAGKPVSWQMCLGLTSWKHQFS